MLLKWLIVAQYFHKPLTARHYFDLPDFFSAAIILANIVKCLKKISLMARPLAFNELDHINIEPGAKRSRRQPQGVRGFPLTTAIINYSEAFLGYRSSVFFHNI